MNEDERHCAQIGRDDRQDTLLEGVDLFECMAPSWSGGVTVAPTLYIRCYVDVWAARRLRRNRAIIEWRVLGFLPRDGVVDIAGLAAVVWRR